MKRSSLMIAGILSTLAASAFSQGLVEGVTESTDPAKVAAVEQHAAELRAQAQSQSATPTKPAHSKMRHHGKMHGGQSHAKTPPTDKSPAK